MIIFHRAGGAIAAFALALGAFCSVSAAHVPLGTTNPTHLSISVSSHWVTFGEKVTMRVELTDQNTGLPLAGEQVTFSWGETDVVLLVSRTTSAVGAASLTIRPFNNTSVQAAYEGSSAEAASMSASRAIHVRQAVRIHSPAEFRGASPGHRVLVWGTVLPAYFGMAISVPPQPHYVYIQWHNRSGWHRQARVELKRQLLPNGKRAVGYVTHIVPKSGRLRTVAPDSGFNERGVSRTLHIAF